MKLAPSPSAVVVAFRCHPSPIRAKRGWVRDLLLQFGALGSPAAALLVLVLFLPIAACAGSLALPPEARQAMDLMYGGNPDAAISIARRVQKEQPDHPLGYLLEAEALGWERFCVSCEIRYGMVDAWKRGKEPRDDAYLAVAGKEISAAEALLAQSDTAEMHVYAGLGYALRARVYGW